MRVVVTGGGGFIGSHLTDALLADGHEVLVVDDFSTGRRENLEAAGRSHRFHLIEADITGRTAREDILRFRPDALLLLAAQSGVKVSMQDPELDARVNVMGLVAMLEVAREAGPVKCVLAASGGTIFGEVAPEDLPVSEMQIRGATSSFYGLTKSVAVEYLRLYREHRGVPSCALALGNVYGERQDPHGEAGVVAIFLERMRSGLPCVINGDGRTTRDFVHVADVVDAFVRSLDRGSGLINIGTGIETSVAAVHTELASHFSQVLPIHYGPPLPGEIRRVSLDASRAKHELGWTPTVTFKEGIAGMVETGRDL